MIVQAIRMIPTWLIVSLALVQLITIWNDDAFERPPLNQIIYYQSQKFLLVYLGLDRAVVHTIH